MASDKLQTVLSKENLNVTEMIYLLGLEDSDQIDELFSAADQCRVKYCGDEVHIRAVVEISNFCTQHCMYCENREENFNLHRYRMEPEKIVDTAKRIAKLGIGTIVLQSGEDLQFDTDIIAYIIYSIKQSTDVAISLSLGERGLDEYRAWKIAGADRYFLKFETSNEKKYSTHRSKKFLTDRVQHLKYLKRLGYQIGSGNIIGLPSQSLEEITDDILLLKELDADIALFDTLIPQPHTPYQNVKQGSKELTLKTVAVARLVLKNVHIASNLFEIDLDEHEKILCCGTNVVMPDFTPHSYLTDSSEILEDHRGLDPFENQKRLQKEIEALGRRVSYSKGHSLKKSASIYL